MASEDILQIESQIESEVGMLDLAGELRAESRYALERQLRDWGEGGMKRVVIGCAGLSYIDSAGLSTMIGALHRLRRAGGDLILVGMNPRLRSLFEISSMHTFFKVLDDLPAARTHFGIKPPPPPRPAAAKKKPAPASAAAASKKGKSAAKSAAAKKHAKAKKPAAAKKSVKPPAVKARRASSARPGAKAASRARSAERR